MASPPASAGGAPTVRDAAVAAWRRLGCTTVFANPGSSEVPLLAGLPDDIGFVLGLHEATVVGAATGHAIATGRPSLVVLHTTAGFGNAVSALATARVNRAPLVVIVGQQDRRHLAQRPFLTGDLDGLAGSYPVWSCTPALARDVPGALVRAWHEARRGRGPAVVVVPMGDWDEPADPVAELGPAVLHDATGVDPGVLDPLVAMLDAAGAPALVVGADADDARTWSALTDLAERLRCPVWQESFGARAGFPQDHPQFRGHLPSGRSRLRALLAPHDTVLVVGAPAFRQYGYEPGPLVADGTVVAMVVDDPELAHHSRSDLAVVGPLAPVCRQLAGRVAPRAAPASSAPAGADGPTPADLRACDTQPVRTLAFDAQPADVPASHTTSADGASAGGGGRAPGGAGAGSGLRAVDVFAALARRLPPEAIVVEETPSSRPELHAIVPARRPLGFVSAAMGGLGFALPAAVGLRMGRPDRPVVAVVGDGSALYAIQALWTAAHYGVGVLFVVLRNGRYAIMDHLARRHGAPAPWPGFAEVDVATLAGGFGCPSRHVAERADLYDALDTWFAPGASPGAPLLLQVAVADEPTLAV